MSTENAGQNAEWVARGRAVITPNYNPAPMVLSHGEGVWLYDLEGKRYLDFTAGIAVCALGHNHRQMTLALADQARSLLHVSNMYFSKPAIELSEKLIARSFADRVFFANSGAEANEAALKIARRYQQVVKDQPRRHKFICTEKSFHGRTWAAISATGQPKYHQGFGPLVPGFVHVPYNDLAAVEAVIDDETCAIFVEPMQGEGGLKVPDLTYLKGLRALCDQHGLLLIFDEVQTGVGRLGTLFAYEQAAGWGSPGDDTAVIPDIMSLAKGLGGGVPIGAMLCTDAVAQGFQPGVHATTFGGNPLACRAGNTVLDVIEEDGLLQHVMEVGAYLGEALEGLGDIPGVEGARGLGLLRGVVVDPERFDRVAVRARCLEAGLLLTQAGADVLRMSPPLIVGPAHIDEAVKILREVLLAMSEEN